MTVRRARRLGAAVGVLVVALGACAAAVVAAEAAPAGATVPGKGSPTGEPRWLGSRTTDDGIQLRVTAAAVDPARVAPGMALPDRCFADEVVSVGVSTPRVAQTVVAVFRTDADAVQVSAPTTAQGALSFVAPGDDPPVDVVIVKAPRRAATVEARAVGWEDAAPVDGGYAVLARQPARGARSTPRRRAVRVRVLDGGGKVLDTARGTFGRADTALVDWDDPACNPETSTSGSGTSSGAIAVPSTVALPEPVGAPPADEDAARTAITAAFEGAYPADGDIDAALAHVEGGDSAVVREARRRAADANPQYVGRVTAVVTEIRFLDAREAAVRFEFRLDGKPFYSPQLGFATLTDAGWKMSRSTYCDQLQTAAPGLKC